MVRAPFQRKTALGRETMGPMTFAEVDIRQMCELLAHPIPHDHGNINTGLLAQATCLLDC